MQYANYHIYSSNDIKTQLAICRIWAHKVFIKASSFKTDSFSYQTDPFFPPNIEAASTTPITIPKEKRVIFHTNFFGYLSRGAISCSAPQLTCRTLPRSTTTDG